MFARWMRAEFNEKFISGIGPEMVEQFVRSLHGRDLSHATMINQHVAGIAEQVAEGDSVVNHFTLSGTHSVSFQGVPATGKPVMVTGLNLMRCRGLSYLDTARPQ